MDYPRYCNELLHVYSPFISGEVTWIIGDSFVFWGSHQYQKDTKAYPGILPHLRWTGALFHGIRGLKLGKLCSLVHTKLTTEKVLPSVIIIHCGTNDINHYVNVNQLITKVHATLREIFQQVKKVSPKTKILWSDVIHRVHTKGVPQPFAKMFVNNLNAVAQMLVVMEEFDFISDRKSVV